MLVYVRVTVALCVTVVISMIQFCNYVAYMNVWGENNIFSTRLLQYNSIYLNAFRLRNKHLATLVSCP